MQTITTTTPETTSEFPALRLPRTTVTVKYHGTDTYRFSGRSLEDNIEHVDRFGDSRRYDTLTEALGLFFADTKDPLIVLARWISLGSVTNRSARHIAERLQMEEAEGFDDPALANILDLPRILAERGIDIR